MCKSVKGMVGHGFYTGRNFFQLDGNITTDPGKIRIIIRNGELYHESKPVHIK